MPEIVYAFGLLQKKELKTVFKQEISRQRLKLLFKVNPRHRASCTRSVQVIRSPGDPGRIVGHTSEVLVLSQRFSHASRRSFKNLV